MLALCVRADHLVSIAKLSLTQRYSALWRRTSLPAEIPARYGISGLMRLAIPWVRADFRGPRTRLAGSGCSSEPFDLLMQWEPIRQSCLNIDLFSGNRVGEFQTLGMQEISSIAGEARKICQRLAG